MAEGAIGRAVGGGLAGGGGVGSFALWRTGEGGFAVCASAGILLSAGGRDSGEAQWALCDGSSRADAFRIADVPRFNAFDPARTLG